MKILFLTTGPDVVASSRARVYQYLPYLRKEGIRARVIPVTSRRQARRIANNLKLGPLDRIYGKIHNSLRMVWFILLAPFFDIVFIQKVILPFWLARLIKRINPNIVCDFDDAVFLCGEGVSCPASAKKQPYAGFLRYAGRVIVSNDFLKEELSDIGVGNISVLTTPVDIQRFSGGAKNKSGGPVVIGWIGSPGTSEYLNDLKCVFEAVAAKYPDVSFEFVGADGFYKGLPGYTLRDWNFVREPQDLSGFDIGIMPLRDDQWCRGKAGYKLLQYMACGIASVSSPVGINKKIVIGGVNGFLADSTDEWFEKLCLLIDNPELRHSLGRGGRKTVQESYSYEVNYPRLIGIFKNISKK